MDAKCLVSPETDVVRFCFEKKKFFFSFTWVSLAALVMRTHSYTQCTMPREIGDALAQTRKLQGRGPPAAEVPVYRERHQNESRFSSGEQETAIPHRHCGLLLSPRLIPPAHSTFTVLITPKTATVTSPPFHTF